MDFSSEEKPKVCMLCNKIDYGDYNIVADIIVQMMKALSLKPIRTLISESVICNYCLKKLEKCYQFKSCCLRTESHMNSITGDSKGPKLSQINVDLTKSEDKIEGNGPEGQTVCRLCMGAVKYDHCFSLSEGTGYRESLCVLSQYFPELDVNSTRDPVICESCCTSLKEYATFMREYAAVKASVKVEKGEIDLHQEFTIKDEDKDDEFEADVSDKCTVIEIYCENAISCSHDDTKIVGPAGGACNASQTTPRRIKKKYPSIPDFCFYCKTAITNFARHVQRQHKLEPEIKEILALPKQSRERRILLTILRNRGNFLKNAKALYKPVHRSRLNNREENYVVCPFCLGMYSRKHLFRHKKNCPQNRVPGMRTTLSDSYDLLLPKMYHHLELRQKVFPRMAADHVSLVAKKDLLICAFGSRYLSEHKERIHQCSLKMRQLAKVLLECRRLNPAVKHMFHLMKPQHFDTVVESVRIIAKYDAMEDKYASPSFALHIGRSLRVCCDIAALYVISQKRNRENIWASQTQDNLTEFGELMKDRWKDKISSKAEKDLTAKIKNKTGKEHNELEGNIAEKDGSVAKLNINQNGVIRREVKIGSKRKLIPWTPEQKIVVSQFFKKHIRLKKPPKKYECMRLIDLFPDLLRNKSWLKIKVFVQNEYVKLSCAHPTQTEEDKLRRLTGNSMVLVQREKRYGLTDKTVTGSPQITPEHQEKPWEMVNTRLEDKITQTCEIGVKESTAEHPGTSAEDGVLRFVHIEGKPHEDNSSEDSKLRIKTGTKRQLVPWTSEQKRVVCKVFKDHIRLKKPPKERECMTLIEQHPNLLKNKSWTKIKVFIQNVYSKRAKYED